MRCPHCEYLLELKSIEGEDGDVGMTSSIKCCSCGELVKIEYRAITKVLLVPWYISK